MKARVFLVNHNRMLYDIELESDLDINYSNNHIWMLKSDLSDIKGRNIYESDRIEYILKGRRYCSTIVFKKSCFFFRVNTQDVKLTQKLINSLFINIVGNRYEN